jgi:hypothetical protein
MLHALVRGKIQPTSADPDRLEDAITSTVIGSLVLVGAWDLLGLALRVRTDTAGPFVAWFWPRLARAEPDVVLRFGDTLVVVEAKYRAGKHSAPAAEPDIGTDEVRDQLVREWDSVLPQAVTDRYPASLAEAVRTCARHLVYLVDSRRIRAAQADLKESLIRVRSPNANMRLVTWQEFHAILHRRPEGWATLLVQFLRRSGLASFTGEWALYHRAELPDIRTWRLISGSDQRPRAYSYLHPLADDRGRSLLIRALARVRFRGRESHTWHRWCPEPSTVDQIRGLTSFCFSTEERWNP